MTRRSPAALLALAGASLWGTTGTSQALLDGHHSPVAVGALRVWIAVAVLLAVALSRGASAWLAVPRQGRWRWLLVAGVGVGGYQLCFFAAVARTGVGVGTLVVLATAPAAAGLLGAVLMHDRPTRRWLASTVVALAGAGLLVLGSGSEHHLDALGLLLAVASGACFATYTVAGRALAGAGDGIAVLSWIFLVSAALVAVPLASQDLAFVTSPRNLLVLAWLGVAATAVAYLLYQLAMRQVSAATAATLALAEPMVANILAVVVLHEPFTWLMAVGVALVLTGLALLGRS